MSYRHLTLAVLLVTITACATPQQPNSVQNTIRADAGNAAAGLAYAQQACAQCHAVGAGRTWSPNNQAPAFQALANTPGMTGAALSAWLHTPHQNMPDFVVPPDRVDDLAAYLASLRDRS